MLAPSEPEGLSSAEACLLQSERLRDESPLGTANPLLESIRPLWIGSQGYAEKTSYSDRSRCVSRRADSQSAAPNADPKRKFACPTASPLPTTLQGKPRARQMRQTNSFFHQRIRSVLVRVRSNGCRHFQIATAHHRVNRHGHANQIPDAEIDGSGPQVPSLTYRQTPLAQSSTLGF